jgi:MFS family permease
MYDTLKENDQQHRFNKVLANSESIGLVATGIASIVGGSVYMLNNRLPFYLVGLSMLLGLVTAIFLKEPKVDTDTFSWENYKKQTALGFSHLFDKNTKRLTIGMMFVSLLFTVMYNIGFDLYIFNQGFSGPELGIIFAATYAILTLVSQAAPIIQRKIGDNHTMIIMSFIYGAMIVITSRLSSLLGVLFLIASSSSIRIVNNTRSKILNDNTQSHLRATTLSTYNMLVTLPYAVLAYLIGKSTDIYGYRTIILSIGILVIIAAFNQLKLLKPSIKKTSAN